MVDVGTAVGYLMLDTSGFQSGFKSALADLQTFRDESATAADKFSAAGGAMSAVGGSLTKSVTLPLVGVGAAVMRVGSDFEAQMSRVQAISGATGDELKALTDLAIDLGATTAFSASEVAQGMENLASAGFTTQEIMSAMPGLLDLAASSGAELGTASEIAASAIRGFGLEASDAGHVADVFAEAAARTNAQTEDMGEAMKYIAPVAKAMGQSLEETAAAVGIMSDAGIQGSQAGTSLRGALSRLAKPTDDMLAKMEELGLSFYDAQGNMLPLNGIIEQLETNMAGLTQEQKNNALVTLFGQESLSGMLALMERGPDELRALTESFENCDGSAAEMAETMLDNTKGSVEEMMGSIETLAIRLQQVMAPAITAVVEKITEFVNKLSSMSPETLQMIVTIAGVVAALGPLLLIFGKITSAVGSVINVFTGLSGAIGGIVSTLSQVGGALTGTLTGPLTGAASTITNLITSFIGLAPTILPIVAVVGTLAAAFKHLWDTNEEFRNGIIETWNGIKESFSNFADGLLERINSLGFNFESLTQVLGAVWTEFCNLLGPLFQGAFDQIAIILETVFGVITGLFDTFKGLFTGDWDTFWQGVTGIFSSLWNVVISTIQNVLNTLGNLVNVILGWFGTSWQELWQSVVDFFSNAWNNILNFFTTMGTNISNAFRSFIDGVVSFFSNLPENLGFIIGQVLGHIANFVVNLGQKAIEAGQTFLTNIINFFQQLPGNIQNFISQALSNIQTWASNLLTSAQQAGQNFINGVVQFFQTLPSRIQTFLTNALNSVKTWGTDMLNAAKTAATDTINGIVNAFTSLPGKMLEIGANLVNGLKDGIMDALGGLLDGIRSFGSSVIDGFESVFGIHSPSTVMAKQGLMLSEGLSVGMQKGESSVMRAAGELADALAGGFQSSFAGLTSAIVGLVNTINESIPGLSIWGPEDQENIDLYTNMVNVLITTFKGLYSVLQMMNEAFTVMANMWASIAQSFTIIRVESLKILETIREQAEAYEDLAESIYEYIEALKKLQEEQERQEEITTRSAESSSSSSSSSGSRVGRAISNTIGAAAAGNTYIFNSPVAVTPTKAARLMKKTAQQLALDF